LHYLIVPDSRGLLYAQTVDMSMTQVWMFASLRFTPEDMLSSTRQYPMPRPLSSRGTPPDTSTILQSCQDVHLLLMRGEGPPSREGEEDVIPVSASFTSAVPQHRSPPPLSPEDYCANTASTRQRREDTAADGGAPRRPLKKLEQQPLTSALRRQDPHHPAIHDASSSPSRSVCRPSCRTR